MMKQTSVTDAFLEGCWQFLSHFLKTFENYKKYFRLTGFKKMFNHTSNFYPTDRKNKTRTKELQI